jgi:hypothetical protein
MSGETGQRSRSDRVTPAFKSAGSSIRNRTEPDRVEVIDHLPDEQPDR